MGRCPLQKRRMDERRMRQPGVKGDVCAELRKMHIARVCVRQDPTARRASMRLLQGQRHAYVRRGSKWLVQWPHSHRSHAMRVARTKRHEPRVRMIRQDVEHVRLAMRHFHGKNARTERHLGDSRKWRRAHQRIKCQLAVVRDA